MAKKEPVDQQDQPEKPQQAVQAARYTKEQIIRSKKYADSKDVLRALLEPEKTYTAAEVESIRQSFLNKEAK